LFTLFDSPKDLKDCVATYLAMKINGLYRISLNKLQHSLFGCQKA